MPINFPGSVPGFYLSKQSREFGVHKWWGWRRSWGWWWHGGREGGASEPSLRPDLPEHHRDDQLHLRRRHPLRGVGEVALPWRLLLLLYHPHDNRLRWHGARRLGQGRQWRGRGRGWVPWRPCQPPVHLCVAVHYFRDGGHRHVLQSDARKSCAGPLGSGQKSGII